MRSVNISWPGVEQPIGCTYTCGHGASPGIASLTIRPQDLRRIRPVGNLVIGDGQNRPLVLRRARVVDVQYSAPASGARTATVQIADRRWMWAFGGITGQFNVVDANTDLSTVAPGDFVVAGGPYAPGTYRTALNLMRDCLAAMGESATATIGAVPAAAPPVDWQFANPAAELEALANQFGMRLCYQPTTDTAAVLPLGVGGKLPDLPGPFDSIAFDVPGRPSGIVFACGPTVFNDVLLLEAVGLEPDGEVRPVENLSFAPAGGWGADNPHFFAQARATPRLTKSEAIQLAQRHVWRTFRVKMVDAQSGRAPGPNVPGYGRVRDRSQLVLFPVQYEEKSVRGDRFTSPPDVFGAVNVTASPELQDKDIELTNGNTFPDQRLPARASVDTERGLVTFDRIMARVIDGRVHEPILRLRTSFSIRSVVGRRFERLTLSASLDGVGAVSGCPPEYVVRPELVYMVQTGRRPRDWSIREVTNNLAEVSPAAQFYLNAAAAKYAPAGRRDREYAGIVPFSPDGLFHQVTYTIGYGAPSTTRVSVNGEHSAYLPSYPEKRRQRSMVRALAERDVEKARKNNRTIPPNVIN